MPNILSLNDFSKDEIMIFIQRAISFKNGAKRKFEDKYIANLFFEDSTRTHNSFIVAEQKLGLNISDPVIQNSSVNKGETFFDTCLTFKSIGMDALIIRHPKDKYYKELEDIGIRIINAGDGASDHPSQNLLDIITIYEEFNSFENKKVAIVGDIKHSRVAHSNMKIFKKMGMEVVFSGPKELYDESCDEYGKFYELDDIIDKVDILNLLRVQNERFEIGEKKFKDTEYLEKYGLNETRYKRLKDKSIVIHPAPINRDVEWQSSIILAEKSRYVKQMENGVFARMAMLEYVLS